MRRQSGTATPSTVFDALEAAAAQHGEREFLVIGRREEVASFAGLAAAADRFGRMLAGLGVRPGDRVALWMTNRLDWAEAAFGIARAGAVMVGVSTRLAVREVAHMLALTRPRVWLLEDVILGKVDAAGMVAPVLAALREQGVPEPVVVVRASEGRRHPSTLDWQERLAATGNGASLPPAAELVAAGGGGDFPEVAGVAAILSTSGTTAAPKGVMLRHAGLLDLAAACAERQELSPTERFYTIGPFFHCSGYMHGLLTNLLAGSTMFTTRRYQPDEAWDVITGECITAYHGFIGVMQDLARRPAAERAGRLLLNRAWYSAPAVEMARLESELGMRQCEVYGLTETGGNVAICRASDPVAMRHDSDGQPHEGLEVRIVDPATGSDQPDTVPGEIRVRGWNLMQGYFRDPEATRKAIDGDGFLHTGDQGVRLPGGFIKFLSRLKDIIRVGGENLSPLEVEEVITAHPAVAEVVVVAGPHPRLTEVPVAFLILKPGASVTEAELDSHCRAQLANFKVPTSFRIVDDFPRTGATSRVQKAQLRAQLEAESRA